MLREIAFNAVFLTCSKGRVGEDDVHSIGRTIAYTRARQRIVVPNKTRVLDTVKQHVRDTKHLRELLFLNGAEGFLHVLLILHRFHITLAHVVDGASEKPASAAGRV